MKQPDADLLRDELVNQLVTVGAVRSEVVESAFRKVPRHLFVHGLKLEEVYGDFSLITKQIGSIPMTSSTQPSLMAAMLESLELKEGLKVLEIGTGTGYNAALLCEIVRDPHQVFTIDIDPDNIEDARSNLSAADYLGLTVQLQEGSRGLPAHAPYDRIVATCSVREIPQSWIDQLKDGGVLVAPIWVNGAQITPSLTKQNGVLIGRSTTLGGFMEMRPQAYQELLTADSSDTGGELLISTEHAGLFDEQEVIRLLEGVRKETKLSLEGLSPSNRIEFFVFLALREEASVEVFLENDEDRFGFGDAAAGIVDCKRQSACLISRDWRVLVYGKPYAYEKVLSVATDWDRLGRPGLDRLHVSVYPRGTKLTSASTDAIFHRPSTLLVISVR
ncbi:MAG: methyltransferase domain-containing protein [Gaiellaceae bacterium]